MSSVEQTNTKGISFKFLHMISVSITDKSNLEEDSLANIIEKTQVTKCIHLIGSILKSHK